MMQFQDCIILKELELTCIFQLYPFEKCILGK